ncbi:MAG: GTP pyrophosphokinase family protein, partial [Lachnospiraceae bacterium]|nr:GTP pyrophosphokinase family protein [Lachnospiraceae bacterium]
MEEANSVDIYAGVRPELERIMNRLAGEIGELAKNREGDKLYEHLAFRIKSDESAREKLIRKGFEVTAENALRELKDSIGLRVVCLFVDDVYECVRLIKTIPYVSVFKEKDYISEAKPNGYRSYHMILEVKE